jgi:hypothetical protein
VRASSEIRVLSAEAHRKCHLVIRRRVLAVCSKYDLIVELLEELERDPGDIEGSNEVPSRVECAENLLRNVENIAPRTDAQPTQSRVACAYNLPGLRTVDLLRGNQNTGG